ncbi:MAG: hypothetical protein EXR27_11750 [Betaproteobacteria bacterium]|nr:hypothetical protein [Betaproteobacteria bacterium]
MKRMQTAGSRQLLALCVGLSLAVGQSGMSGAQELRPYKFASVGDKPTSAAELYFGLGLEKGWFKEAGIDFQVRRMLANVAYPAIVSNDIDGALYGSSAAIAALRGVPLVVAYLDQISSPWSLVVDPKKIKTPKDLKGARCVAATGAKTATHIAWAAMIDSIGGDPRAFQAVGIGQPPPFWLEALRTGTAECILGFDAAWTGVAQREGYKALAYLPDVSPMQTNGLSVSSAALKDPKRRELLKDVIGVFLRSHAYIRDMKNRSEVAGIVRNWMGSPKALQNEDYEAAVAEIVRLAPPKGYIENESLLDNMLKASLKYDIYDAKEFKVDVSKVSMSAAGVVDQSVAREAAAWGAPRFRRP